MTNKERTRKTNIWKLTQGYKQIEKRTDRKDILQYNITSPRMRRWHLELILKNVPRTNKKSFIIHRILEFTGEFTAIFFFF